MFGDFNYAAVQEQVATAERAGLAPLRVVILRNVTLEPIEPYLAWAGLRLGCDPTIAFGNFDTILQDAADPAVVGGADVVVVCATLDQLAWPLARAFATLSAGDIEAEMARIDSYVGAVLAGLRANGTATVLWLGFAPPPRPALGIMDAQGGRGEADMVVDLNRRLRDRLAAAGGAYYVDMAGCVARVGATAFYDRRYWHMGKAPYSRLGLREIAAELMRFLQALRGRTRKCLVLDCDNTLWGGVIGEDGLEGIRLGADHPGSCFREFQQEILNLHHRGVLLALCSKNEADEVWQVFDRHPGMLLTREHITAHRINWQDKPANLRAIARELNIGVDALVLADDSDFEIELVRRELPEVAVLPLPVATPYLHRDRLAGCGLFDSLGLTAEDRSRATSYRAEAQRSALRETTTDLAGYCASLEMVLELRRADAAALPRLAQLTQKTNQFNLTTRRYGEADIAALATHGDVLAVHLADRFGSAGLVGQCILRYDGGDAVIDTLLLSCRVLGRGVEDALIAHVARLARVRGASRLIGEYVATAKNAQVAEFFPKRGFVPVGAGEGRAVFALDLGAEPLPVAPAFFKAVVSVVDDIEGESAS